MNDLATQQFGYHDIISLSWGPRPHFLKSHVIHLDKHSLWRYSGKSA